MDTNRITNVLIFKDGFYWLTTNPFLELELKDDCYEIIPEEWELHNGFESAADAFSYIAHLESLPEERIK